MNTNPASKQYKILLVSLIGLGLSNLIPLRVNVTHTYNYHTEIKSAEAQKTSRATAQTNIKVNPNAIIRVSRNTSNEGRVSKAPINDCKYWDKVIDKYARSSKESTWAKRVMRCESSCREHVVNSLGYTGLFQWSRYYWSKQFKESVWDGEAQVKNSLWKYRMGGAGIWECK